MDDRHWVHNDVTGFPSSQGRRQEFFQGGSTGYILHFSGGVGDQIFTHLYGQNKKIAEPGGSADPPWPPLPTPLGGDHV